MTPNLTDRLICLAALVAWLGIAGLFFVAFCPHK